MTRQALLFDAGNTLLHLDAVEIARVVSEHGWTVEPQVISAGECHARWDVSQYLGGDGESSTESEDVRHFYVRKSVEHALRLAPAHPPRAGVDLAVIIERLVAILLTTEGVNRLWSRVLPGTREKLECLARDYAIGVISNSDGAIARRLDEAGLDGLFEVVLDSAIVGSEKPDPTIFRAALDTLQVAADRATYIGDIYSVDVLGAGAVGMRGVLVDPLDVHAFLDCRRVRSILEL